jgi:hypothetical protein
MDKVILQCIGCSRKLRLPKLENKIRVTCPGCKGGFQVLNGYVISNIEGSAKTQHEGRQWLSENPNEFAADRFGTPGSTLGFVQSLYSAGALNVFVELETGKDYSTSITFDLPEDETKRSQLFNLIHTEEENCSEDFCATPSGKSGREMTLNEAGDIGDPTMEGYWLEEEEPCQDVGQINISLWWD